MTDSLKVAARNGNPKAIEALMNQSFGKKGITTRVLNSGSTLKITLRGSTLPDQKYADLVKKGIAAITPQGFTQVSLKGEQIGGKQSWTAKWDLDKKKAVGGSATVITSSKKSPWFLHPGILSVALIIGGLGSLLGIHAVMEELSPEPPPRPKPIYPKKAVTGADVFEYTLKMKTPGVLARDAFSSLNLTALKDRCPDLVEASSTVGINTAIATLASELRLNKGYDEKLAVNLATGVIEGCAAWVRGERINPLPQEDRSQPPVNKEQIDEWDRKYGSK